MASEDGFETHSLIEALAADPYRFDFYHAVRSLEALHPTSPRVGSSLRAADDPVRFCQAADPAGGRREGDPMSGLGGGDR